MNAAIDNLTIQFLAWVAAQPRTYAEVMDAWRTSCPRLTIWEDAQRDGLVRIEHGAHVTLTPGGLLVLERGNHPA